MACCMTIPRGYHHGQRGMLSVQHPPFYFLCLSLLSNFLSSAPHQYANGPTSGSRSRAAIATKPGGSTPNKHSQEVSRRSKPAIPSLPHTFQHSRCLAIPLPCLSFHVVHIIIVFFSHYHLHHYHCPLIKRVTVQPHLTCPRQHRMFSPIYAEANMGELECSLSSATSQPDRKLHSV